MLCQACQTSFPFYLKYCRNCGSKLVKENRAQSNTTQMASLIKRAEVGNVGVQYCTSPMTQQMGKQVRSIAEMLQNILDEFPSLETTKMPDNFIPSYRYCRKMSRTEQLRQTLREFDMSELQELERHSKELEINDSYSYAYSYSANTNVNSTATIEFKRPSAYLGTTLPFASNIVSQKSALENDIQTRQILINRASQTKAFPSKLLLPSSRLLSQTQTVVNNNGLAFTVRQTLSNLWVRMRELAENVAVNFSVKKSI
jgi:vacuolar-type H+-ATPase subunit I/STV1